MITSFVEKSSINGEIIEISDKVEINHMKNSFRLQLGDRLRVVDGEFEYITEIIEITKKTNENVDNSDIGDKTCKELSGEIAS